MHVVTAMFRFTYEKSSDILGVTLTPRRKTTETDYFLHQCFNSTCMIYKLSNLLAKFFFYMVSAAVNQIELFKFDRCTGGME